MLKLFLLSLLLICIAIPAQADWQRGIDGAGTDLTGANLVVNQRFRDAYFYIANPSTADSSWLSVAEGSRVRIHLNTDADASTVDATVQVNIKLLTHNRANVTPSLNDAVTLINLTMSSTEDQFYDLDGPVKILVDPIVTPAGNAYVSVIVQNPPAGD